MLNLMLTDLSTAVPHYYTRSPSSTITVHTNLHRTRPSVPFTLVERRFGSPTALKGHTITSHNGFPLRNIHGYPRVTPTEISLEDRVISKLLRNHSPLLRREESLWPEGVFIPPIDPKRMGYGPNEIETDYTRYHGWQEYDPFLLTGYEALTAVKRLTARGELFFGDIPHDRQLRWLNFLRKCNRLAGHIRASERPGFPFYRI